MGARAKGGGESTGLKPEAIAIFYFFVSERERERERREKGERERERGTRAGWVVATAGGGGVAGFWFLQGVLGGGRMNLGSGGSESEREREREREKTS